MPPVTPGPTDVPDDEIENASSANVENPVLAFSDSDSMSDSENIDHNGYELLSQDPGNFYSVENDEEDNSCASDIEESVTAEVNSFILNPPFHPSAEQNGRSDIGDSISSEIPVMDKEHVETIKTVMKGITLPSSNLPQWASLVPEEEWKAALFSEMKARQAESSRNRREIHSTSVSNNNKFDIPNDVLR